jgi:hypothetical protein
VTRRRIFTAYYDENFHWDYLHIDSLSGMLRLRLLLKMVEMTRNNPKDEPYADAMKEQGSFSRVVGYVDRISQRQEQLNQ